MSQIKLKVESIEQALRKDGTPIDGITNGREWRIFKINEKYSYIQGGGGEPSFEIGREYPFELETKVNGKYTNYTLSLPKKIEVQRFGEEFHEEEVIPDTMGDIMEKIGELKEFNDKIAKPTFLEILKRLPKKVETEEENKI